MLGGDAHRQRLDHVGAEGRIVGVPLGVAVGTVLISSVRSAWRRRHEVPVYWIAAATALLVCGLWDMPQLRAFAAVMGGLALGLVSRHDTPDGSETES